VTSAECRPPDWIALPSTQLLSSFNGSSSLQTRQIGSSVEPKLCASCNPWDAAAHSGGEATPWLARLDATLGKLTAHTARIAGKASLPYYNCQSWLMLSQVLSKYTRRALAQDRNCLGGRG
jgi:hypothetical protein